MTNIKDRTGFRSGRLEALRMTKVVNGRMNYIWHCDCGREFESDGKSIFGGRKVSCGCRWLETQQNHNLYYTDETRCWRRQDLTGTVFGRLTVVAPAEGRTRKGGMRWYCVCSCGGERVIAARNLIRGRSVSCGCRLAETKVENLEAARALRRAYYHSPLGSLFHTPHIRKRKSRKIKLMDDRHAG
jgi:hypothetical protein